MSDVYDVIRSMFEIPETYQTILDSGHDHDKEFPESVINSWDAISHAAFEHASKNWNAEDWTGTIKGAVDVGNEIYRYGFCEITTEFDSRLYSELVTMAPDDAGYQAVVLWAHGDRVDETGGRLIIFAEDNDAIILYKMNWA